MSERRSRESLERQAVLVSRKSARTGSPGQPATTEGDDSSVLTKDSVDLGDNRQFSISVEMRTGGVSPGTEADGVEVEVPMDGINRPYSRQVMSAVTPSEKRSLQDYFKDPEFDLTRSVRASRAGRREHDNGSGDEVSLSDRPPAVKAPSANEFSPDKIKVKVVDDQTRDDATEMSYHTTQSSSVSLPSIYPVRAASSGGFSRPMTSEHSYDDDDDEEYMEMELRNMLAQTHSKGRDSSKLSARVSSPTVRVGESQSLPVLPVIETSKPKVHVPKARKIFGSADISSDKKKIARQGTLLSFSDSMPILVPPGQGLGDGGLELRSEKPHMVDRYKALAKKKKKPTK
jgi:hypothetical protein